MITDMLASRSTLQALMETVEAGSKSIEVGAGAWRQGCGMNAQLERAQRAHA